MTNDNLSMHPSEKQPSSLGTRLKSAREARGLAHKDAALQLRLNEKIIKMMEINEFPSDLPITFIRGYFRSYGKLLDIPEHEIKQALEPLHPKPILPCPPPSEVSTLAKPHPLVKGKPYVISFFTYLIIATLIGLIAVWWYNRSAPVSSEVITDHTALLLPENNTLNELISPPSSPILDQGLEERLAIPLAVEAANNKTNETIASPATPQEETETETEAETETNESSGGSSQ